VNIDKQIAPTCNKQMNISTLCMDIQQNLYWVITAAAPYPTKLIGVQINSSNLT